MQPARLDTLPVPAPPQDSAGATRAARDVQLAQWLQRAAGGDARSFESFYDATIGYAQSLARRLLRDSDIDDVLADSFFQAWREAPRFDPARGSAVTWLLTRVHSRAMDLRRQQRRDGAAADPDDERMSRCPSDLPGPEDLLALAESGTRLAAALAGLSAPERWVLGLAYFRELSHGAIADATGMPLGTVKSLLLRAQHKLRQRFAEPAANGPTVRGTTPGPIP
jgi:RNA polymerase sigma-70 factor (ECF subfamily)